MSYKVVSDEEAQERNVKILIWGPAGSRKTEMAPRHLPNVLVIDSEKNARHAKGAKGIPDFTLVETTDALTGLEVMQDAIDGKLKSPKGEKIETISIDSMARFKEVRTDAATIAKDNKAKKGQYYDPDKVFLTLQDRGKISQPLKRMISMVAQAGVKFFVVVAREKNVWMEVPDPQNSSKTILKKTDEVVPDGVNNMYEFNLIFYVAGKGASWSCRVDKTQGKLAEIFAAGESLDAKTFAERMKALRAYSEKVRESIAPDEVSEQVAQFTDPEPKKEFAKTDLAAYKAKMGVVRSITDALTAAGLPSDKIDPARETEYKAVVDKLAAEK